MPGVGRTCVIAVLGDKYNLCQSWKNSDHLPPEHTSEQVEQHQFWEVCSLWNDPEWVKPGDFLTHVHQFCVWQNELGHLSLELHRKAGLK